MQNILRLLEESSNFPTMRDILIRTVKELLELRQEEISALAELEKCKRDMNESRYAAVLGKPASKDKLDEILIQQYALRSLLVNSVLRCHEARSGMKQRSESIEISLNSLGSPTEPAAVLTAVALRHLVDSIKMNDAEDILTELDKVDGIDRDSLIESVQTIFKCKKTRKGLFADRYTTARMLPMCYSIWGQGELLRAVNAAKEVREELDVRWERFIAAQHNAELRFFTRTMESAILSGDSSLVDRIRLERKAVEADLFVSASMYQLGMEKVAREDVALQAAFDKTAMHIDENDLSIENLKAMCHALGAWLWLGELRFYIAAKYSSHNVPQVLKELAFDSVSYLKR